MYEVMFTEAYTKLAEKWVKKHPDLRNKYYNVIQLLEINPFHNSLRLHKLKGAISDFYSVSIDMKYRIIIDFIIQDNKIIPLNIGDHGIYK
jgi:mRNA-degrading endonuclease YafQ of YafQ-DinJ toxin-antitoxin module